MVDEISGQGNSIEERKDLGTDDSAAFQYWIGQDKIAEKGERKWIKQARQIIKRYRDERVEALKESNQFNILWSNVQTLIPTLYARTPEPDVERRFKDDDPTARLSSILIERCLSYSADQFDFDEMMLAVTEDRLLPGRGVARVLYIPHFGEEIKPDEPEGVTPAGDNAEFENADDSATVNTNPGDQPKEELPREVVYEEVRGAYVFWEDYREGPARKWIEVPWVRFRSYMTRDELLARFGKDKGEKVNLDYSPKGGQSTDREDPPPDMFKKAVIYEFWDKVKQKVIWLAPGTPDLVLDEVDDPLKLPGFYPNPNPCFATMTNDKRVPVPDYIEYQDQARELDNLTARIDILTKAMKVTGFYPGENKQVLQQVFDEGMENKLIPVEDWAFFSDKGASGGIQWVPIEQVAQTLIQLYDARERVKNILYEVTGIGDIMRGQTSPDETLGAQELKANFSTRRITPQQKAIARFARDMFRLMGGVIAEHFSAKTISQITGYPQLLPVPQMPPRPQAPPPQLAPPQQAQPAQQSLPGMAPPQQPQPSPQMQQYQQAMQQWQQQVQQIQGIISQNQQKQQQFDQAVALIKQDGVHGFRIGIEADSTIAPDEQAEKNSRTQFMQQFIPFMETVVPIAQGNPAMAEMAKELTLFVVRGWRVARPLEETIEKAFAEIAGMPQNPKATGQDKAPAGKQSDPAAIAAQVHETQTDAAVQAQKSSDAVQIAHEKNVTAMWIQNAKSQQAMDQEATSIPIEHAKLGLEATRIQTDKEVAMAREEAAQARSASKLQ